MPVKLGCASQAVCLPRSGTLRPLSQLKARLRACALLSQAQSTSQYLLCWRWQLAMQRSSALCLHTSVTGPTVDTEDSNLHVLCTLQLDVSWPHIESNLPATNTKVSVMNTTTGLMMADGSRNGRFAHGRYPSRVVATSSNTPFLTPSYQACGIFRHGICLSTLTLVGVPPPQEATS